VSGLDEDSWDTIQYDWERIATNIEAYGKNKLKLYFDDE
jgi:hypothetical protein